jgi:hypothetical protein
MTKRRNRFLWGAKWTGLSPIAIHRRIKYLLRWLLCRVTQLASLIRNEAVWSQKVVIFLVPGREFISGGMISIFTLVKLSRELKSSHSGKVVVCFFPEEGCGVRWRYRMFNNEEIICPFEMAMSLCWRANEVIIHIPEYATEYVVERIGPAFLKQLLDYRGLGLNILIQNIQVIPEDNFLRTLGTKIPRLTCTTAHPSYSTEKYRKRWGIPVHFLPAWTAPDGLSFTDYPRKRNLLIVSPDPSPHRVRILERIVEKLPSLEVVVISGMHYEEFLQLEGEAKWSITFGEGLDGYFCGIFRRGGIGFAVYNDEFFTEEYRELDTVFSSYEDLFEKIVERIDTLDNEESFTACNGFISKVINETWSEAHTRQALFEFYKRNFTNP